MGIEISCPECGKVYRTRGQLELLKDNESLCLKCRAFIDVDDWDEIIASFDDEDIDIHDDFDDDIPINVDGLEEDIDEDMDIPEEDDALFGEFTSIEDVDMDEEEDEDEDY